MAKAPADLRSLARAHTELGIQTLAGIARNSTSDAARVRPSACCSTGAGARPRSRTRARTTRTSGLPSATSPRADDNRHRPAAQRLGPAAAQRLWRHLDRHTAICPDRRMPRAASLFVPYFRPRNGQNARAAGATCGARRSCGGFRVDARPCMRRTSDASAGFIGCSLTGNPPCYHLARRRNRVHRIPSRVRC